MLNNCQYIGRLGQDPDSKFTPSGKQVVTLRLAVDGGAKDKTEWVTVIAWEKLAEIMAEYLHKGSLIYVQCRCQTRQWEDNNGNKRYSTEFVADRLKMLDPPNQANQQSDKSPSDYPVPGGGGIGGMGEDVPFAPVY